MMIADLLQEVSYCVYCEYLHLFGSQVDAPP
jgi:hypothetical protein